MKTFRLAVSLGLLAAGLSACWGGGGSDPVAPAVAQVPASAAASPLAYTDYVRDLPSDETAEPMGLDLVANAPTSENDEPVAVN